jgi:hypothetical protein
MSRDKRYKEYNHGVSENPVESKSSDMSYTMDC